MCLVFGKLPALGLELQVLGNERPVEGRHPIGNVVAFADPGLVVVLVGGELDGGEVVYVVM